MRQTSQPDAGVPLFMLGLLGGGIAVVLFTVLVRDVAVFQGSLSATDFSTLLAGFGGAAMGGVISWLLARQTANAAAIASEDDRLSREKAQAFSLFLKIQVISNGLHTQLSYIWEARNKANAAGDVLGELWQYLQPQVGADMPTPAFHAEDYLPLLQAKKAELVNDCQLLSIRYNVLEKSFVTYNQKREELQRMMLPFSKLGGQGQVISEIPRFKEQQLKIRAMELESLAQSLQKSAREDYQMSTTVMKDLSDSLNEYFGPGFVKLQPKPDAAR